MKTLGIIVLILASPMTSEAHEASGTARIGEGKAVLEAKEGKGIRLSEQAQKSIGVRLVPPSELAGTLPKGSIVSYQDKRAVYVLRDGFFKRLELGKLTFPSNLKPSDQLAVEGAALLRASELEAFGSEEEEEGEHSEHGDHAHGEEEHGEHDHGKEEHGEGAHVEKEHAHGKDEVKHD